jgi:CxxC-x17-CxxC domain-containing protein
MKNFYKGNKPGGNRGFGGRDGGRDGGQTFAKASAWQGRPVMMHKATCSNCGKDCQLPFRPNGNRAVFCSACFEVQKNENTAYRQAGRTDRPRFEDPSTRSARAAQYGASKKVFEAVCGNCGDNCLVPFRPFPGKPVFCKKCFAKDDKAVNHIVKTDNSSNKNIEQLKSQIEMLNIKLDRILRMLTPETDRIEDEDEGDMDAEEVELEKMKKKVLKKASPKGVSSGKAKK